MRKNILLVCMALVVYLVGCAKVEAPRNSNNFTNPNTPITLTPKQNSFVLRLKSNASTGYSWALKSYDTHLFTLQEHHYIAPRTAMPGAPGAEEWTFSINPKAFAAPQTSKIELVYRRPWEKIPASTTVVTIITTHIPLLPEKAGL